MHNKLEETTLMGKKINLGSSHKWKERMFMLYYI